MRLSEAIGKNDRGVGLASAQVLILLLLTGWAAPAQAAGVPPSLQALADAYRCELIDRLARIAAGDKTTSKNRFIVVYPRFCPGAYVQCIFVENDTVGCLCAARRTGPTLCAARRRGPSGGSGLHARPERQLRAATPARARSRSRPDRRPDPPDAARRVPRLASRAAVDPRAIRPPATADPRRLRRARRKLTDRTFPSSRRAAARSVSRRLGTASILGRAGGFSGR